MSTRRTVLVLLLMVVVAGGAALVGVGAYRVLNPPSGAPSTSWLDGYKVGASVYAFDVSTLGAPTGREPAKCAVDWRYVGSPAHDDEGQWMAGCRAGAS